ncbi:MAG: UbiA family prenyltransferase [Bacteroidota bacterium]
MLFTPTIQLLRIPFSFFLMPVFLFALSQAQSFSWVKILFVFGVLHILVYPASNAYNSYMDQDEGSIGGLKHPPKADRSLFYLTIVKDITAILVSCFINLDFAIGILLYILASRAYSYRGIRLKKYPFAGYLTVVLFQGAFTFHICSVVFGAPEHAWIAAVACSFLIAGVYPLTQIYQHEADRKDGVKTISMVVGYIGTFILTVAMFTVAMIVLFVFFQQTGKPEHFWILQGFMIPVVGYFMYWFQQTWKDPNAANFENTMRMNLISSICMNACFTLLTILNLTS